MKMSKRKSLLILLAVLCLAIILSYTLINSNPAQNTEVSQPPATPPPSERPELVIPEAPLGILGLMSALAAGFAIFAIMKKIN
jgi:hypothetical protein